MQAHRHCSYCGTKFPLGEIWPKTCTSCAHTTWRNPLPVAVLLIPCDGKLIGVRRKHTSQEGKVALPGGFIVFGESWQEAAAREAKEEALVDVDPTKIELYAVHSAPDDTVLIFGMTPPMKSRELPEYAPTDETCERIMLDGSETLAFPIHEEVVRVYFSRREKHDPR